MDALCLKTGIHGITSPISVGGALEVRTNPTQQVSAVGRSTVDKSTVAAPPQKTALSGFFSFRYPLKSLWPGLGLGGGNGSSNSKRYKRIGLEDAVLAENEEKGVVEAGSDKGTTMGTSYTDVQNGNWVLKILHVSSLWRDREEMKQSQELEKEEEVMVNGQVNNNHDDDDEEEECEVCRIDDDDDDDEGALEFDRDSFSRLLRRVSLTEAKLYAQMSYLGNLAYCIPKIKVWTNPLFCLFHILPFKGRDVFI